jgi:hypothetical protein
MSRGWPVLVDIPKGCRWILPLPCAEESVRLAAEYPSAAGGFGVAGDEVASLSP